jgi:hypothetical protein
VLKVVLTALALLTPGVVRGSVAAEMQTLRYDVGEGGGLSRLQLTVGFQQGFYEREGVSRDGAAFPRS